MSLTHRVKRPTFRVDVAFDLDLALAFVSASVLGASLVLAVVRRVLA